jgi:hypothetical protein
MCLRYIISSPLQQYLVGLLSSVGTVGLVLCYVKFEQGCWEAKGTPFLVNPEELMLNLLFRRAMVTAVLSVLMAVTIHLFTSVKCLPLRAHF